VQTFTADGRRTAGWGQRGEYGIAAQPQPVDAFWGPRAVVVDDRGFIYVADTGNKRVRVYNADGQYMWDIGGGGSGNGQLDEPTGLAIGADGLLYVADTWNRRISVFNLDGTPANKFNKADGSVSNNFRVRAWFDDLGNRPYLAIDAARGYLYVTDPDAGRVLVYDLNGNCVGAFGQLNRETPDLTQFASIGGIAVDGAGFVYVADAGSGRILKFAPYEPPAPVNAGAANPAVQPGIGQPETTQEVEATPEVTEASG
jgi:DNA-binding beta-propeller fold protein YncE